MKFRSGSWRHSFYCFKVEIFLNQKINKTSHNQIYFHTFKKCNKALMPSHSIYTINMEKLICNMWHENDQEEQEDNLREGKST
jgi:hypothetical protein